MSALGLGRRRRRHHLAGHRRVCDRLRTCQRQTSASTCGALPPQQQRGGALSAASELEATLIHLHAARRAANRACVGLRREYAIQAVELLDALAGAHLLARRLAAELETAEADAE